MKISEIRDILKQGTVEKTVLEEIMADERKGAGSWWMPISAA